MTGMFDDLHMTRFRNQPVGIATGGTSQEREISLKTGRAFEEALKAKGYDVTVYDVATDLAQIAADQPAAVLLGIHGGLGEGGALQGFLECLGIPYTGSGVLASALAMDKGRAREICAGRGVPVASGRLVDPGELSDPASLAEEFLADPGLPFVAKLNDSGSSFGVYICESEDDVEQTFEALAEDVGDRSSSGVLVEAFVEGPEYTVGFFDDECLGVIEVVPGEGFYDFEAKYESGDTEYRPVSDPAICEPLEEWSRLALDALGCRGVTRVDFKGRPDREGRAVMLEVNTIPGMTATSLVPKLAAAKGVPFQEFVEAMLVSATSDAGQ